MKSPIVAALPLASAIAWSTALILDSGGYSSRSVLLVGIGLMGTAAVAVVGIVVTGARWARRLALISIAAGLVVGLIRPVDAAWAVAVTLAVVAAGAMFLPATTDRIRRLPAASGPPTRAVVLPLLLLGTPYLLGLCSRDATTATLVVGLSAVVVAFVYARVVPGGLIAIRVIWPVIAIASSPLLGLPAGLVSAMLGALVGWLAWHPSVKTAFHPPFETGSGYSIPPELTPEEILDAANIDDTGQPK